MPSSREYMREWERKNRARRRAYHRERGFTRKCRIPTDEIALLIALQGGVCAMPGCGYSVSVDDKSSHVDHEHSGLNIIRGVLCRDCNVRLGQYEYNREREGAFRAYLGEA